MNPEDKETRKEFKILYDSAKTNTSHKFIVIRNGISRSVEGDLNMLTDPNTEISEVHESLRFWIDYVKSHPERDEINALKRGMMKQERVIFNLKSKVRDRNRMVNHLERSVAILERVIRELTPKKRDMVRIRMDNLVRSCSSDERMRRPYSTVTKFGDGVIRDEYEHVPSEHVVPRTSAHEGDAQNTESNPCLRPAINYYNPRCEMSVGRRCTLHHTQVSKGKK